MPYFNRIDQPLGLFEILGIGLAKQRIVPVLVARQNGKFSDIFRGNVYLSGYFLELFHEQPSSGIIVETEVMVCLRCGGKHTLDLTLCRGTAGRYIHALPG